MEFSRRNFLRSSAVVSAAVVGSAAVGAPAVAAKGTPKVGLGWPKITQEMRPWTRWWWLGSSVDDAGLARHLEQYREVGLGGVEIQPIYGAVGYDDRNLTYLSRDWLDALDAASHHAEANGLGVDLTTGSGWDLGGPWIDPTTSAGNVLVERWTVAGGEQLSEPVRTTQPPHPPLRDEELLASPDDLPPMQPLPEPPLTALVAREAGSGGTVDLTDQVQSDGTLDWTAPEGEWTLTGVFLGRVLTRVERSGTGGKGLALDHFSTESVDRHLDRIGGALGHRRRSIRSLFHDSYELGSSDWTGSILSDFRKLRGYDPVPYLPEVFDASSEGETRLRVLSDFRETFADLFLERFVLRWSDWSHDHGWLSRNQAHGSPGNLLDLYGASDIPETEVFGSSQLPIPGVRVDEGHVGDAPQVDSLVLRFAVSPAHVNGTGLVGSETLTWLGEHYHVALSQAKPEVDRLFAVGVNHIIFHGSTYSPEDAPWPGFSFYAASEMNPTNTLWEHLPELTGYITRCQSILQSGEPDADVLLYFPQHDLWHLPDGGIGSRAEDVELAPDYIRRGEDWVRNHPTGFGDVADLLERRGWQFDYVSDRQLTDFRGSARGVSNRHVTYPVVLVPGARLIPLDTLDHLRRLAEAGATVVFRGSLPEDVPGLDDLEERRAGLARTLDTLQRQPIPGRSGAYRVGSGRVVVTRDDAHLAGVLAEAGAVREPAADQGLHLLRRRHEAGIHYFVANLGASTVSGWVPLGADARSVLALDPLRDIRGVVEHRDAGNGAEVRLHLEPGQSLVLRTFEKRRVRTASYPDRRPIGAAVPLSGDWELEFRSGGPTRPSRRTLPDLVSWTDLGDEEAAFSGTARYRLEFDGPDDSGRHAWLLDLGDVRESARVRLNGRDLGIAWSVPFQLPLAAPLRKARNVLEIEVTNLAANRVRSMINRGELDLTYYMRWNFAEPTEWQAMPSGLLGPVQLIPVDD